MKKLFSYILFISLFACSCKVAPSVVKEDVKSIILEIMADQEKSWNDGDIVGFMDGYWKSDSLSFVGSRLNKGWQTTLDNYKKSYPDKAGMGELRFDIEEVNELSPEVYHVIGRYNLIIGEKTPTGMFSLVWKKINGKWLIVADHSS